MNNIINDWLSANAERRKKEKQAVEDNAAISEQQVLAYLAQAQNSRVLASPGGVPDIQLPEVSQLPTVQPDNLEAIRRLYAIDPGVADPMQVDQVATTQAVQPMPQRQATKADSPENTPGVGYNLDLFNRYVSDMQAQGKTPEFTNIPGASGFLIDSFNKPVTRPSEVDGKMHDIKDPYSYTDLNSLLRDKQEEEAKVTDDLVTAMSVIAEEEGVPKLEQQLKSLGDVGYSNSKQYRSLQAQVTAARARAAGRLSISADGTPTGLDAIPFIRRKQALSKFDIRAKELAKDKQLDDQMVNLQVQTGIPTETLGIIRDVFGKEKIQDVATTSPDVVTVAGRIASGRTLPLDEVVGSYPEALDGYSEYITKSMDSNQALMIKATAKAWRDKAELAARDAMGDVVADKNGNTEVGSQYKIAKDAGDTDRAEAILATVQAEARNRAIISAKKDMVTAWLDPARLSTTRLIGITEEERDIGDKTVRLITEKYGDSLPTGWLARGELKRYLGSNGIDHIKAIPILRRMMGALRDEFNEAYKDTLGVVITSDTPEFKAWGL